MPRVHNQCYFWDNLICVWTYFFTSASTVCSFISIFWGWMYHRASLHPFLNGLIVFLIKVSSCLKLSYFRVVAPVEAVSRPKGQGLGADSGPGHKQQLSKGNNNDGTDETEGFVKGAGILVTRGPHKNLYGLVGTSNNSFFPGPFHHIHYTILYVCHWLYYHWIVFGYLYTTC